MLDFFYLLFTDYLAFFFFLSFGNVMQSCFSFLFIASKNVFTGKSQDEINNIQIAIYILSNVACQVNLTITII